MKKIIPHLILVMSALVLHNCRPGDETYNDSTGKESFLKTLENKSDSATTLLVDPVDPDPPVKDGQDWKHQ